MRTYDPGMMAFVYWATVAVVALVVAAFVWWYASGFAVLVWLIVAAVVAVAGNVARMRHAGHGTRS